MTCAEPALPGSATQPTGEGVIPMLKPIEECRIVLVDDEPVKLEGRLSWLSAAGFSDVTILDFHQALIYQYWGDVHTLAVDGFDDAADEERETWVDKLAPGDRLFELDRYMGVRVVKAAREANPNLVITVISGFVDESPELVQRFHDRGANYIYSTRAAHGKDDFLRAIKNPGHGPGFIPRPRPGQKTNLEKLLDILSGQDSEWDANVVEAVRQVLVFDQNRWEVLRDNPDIRTRQFNGLMDYIKDLSGMPEIDSGATDVKRIRLEAVRSHLFNNILGRKHRRRINGNSGDRQ